MKIPDRVPFFIRGIHDLFLGPRTGIVDEDIDATKLLFDELRGVIEVDIEKGEIVLREAVS